MVWQQLLDPDVLHSLNNINYYNCLQPDEPKDEGAAINYAAATGTIGKTGIPMIRGAEDMMYEMAKRLRERRAKTEGGSGVSFSKP